MNLEKLKVGQTFKNYKELCKTLGIKEKSGKSRQLQIEEFQRYFQASKKGQAITIEKIYPSALRKVDNSYLGGNQKYVKDLMVALLNYLSARSKKETNSAFVTNLQLFEMSGMINSQYRPTKHQIESFLENHPLLEKSDVDIFLERTGVKMRKVLKTTLEILHKKLWINYRPAHLFVNKFFLLKNSDIVKSRSATDEEETTILNIKKDVATEMGFENEDYVERAIYAAGKSKEYNAEVNKRIKEKFGWDYCYFGWRIDFHEDIKEDSERYKKRLEEAELEEVEVAKLSLNGKIGESIDNQARTMYKKDLKRAEKLVEEVWGEMSNIGKKDMPEKYKDEWIEGQLLLTDLLIKLPQSKPK
jgi:hypothetical protein